MPIRDATGYIPVQAIMTCEICGIQVALADTHSISVAYAMPGTGTTAYICNNEQHYACCHEHAIQAAMACLFDHIESGPYNGKKAKYDDQDLQEIDKRLAKFNSKGKIKNQIAAASSADNTEPSIPVVKG